MMKLIAASALALCLVGCTAKTENPSNTGTTPAAVTTDASAKFELGKTV